MRDELPRGTVTFLFTDVEGSTRLLHELGAEAYAEALAEHRRLIRGACAAHGGVEVDTQGDAFFFAFGTAPGGLAAAREAAAALDDGPIRVRAGLHTGTPLLAEEGYVGTDVHRAARIAAAGHGRQVLVSASTAALLDGYQLVDLGEHRFKDLAAPERVFQLGDGDFPPLKTLYRTNLPVPATPFLGRERELAEVTALLARDDVRLLTLTGPGGTGKTRLALQAAAEASDAFPDGVFWVSVAPLRAAALVLEQAMQVLGVEGGQLAAHIGDKRLLLLLDNFEHLLEAAPGLAELVAECPNLVVLVTSRELVQLQAEHAYPVPTLDEEDGVALFLMRARAVSGGVEADEAVAELCERLDNLPLALELAASRTRHLAPAELLSRLSESLDLLRGGRDVDPRQQTLRATMGWSYDLLEPHEQEAFARLSVFAGGGTLEAAAAVADADLDALASLVDKSLVRRAGDRYWMLETIREYAAERLRESGEEDALRRRHAEYFLGLSSTLGFRMEAIEEGAIQRHDVAIAEHNNVRAAIDWATRADPLLGLRLATELENFWVSYSPFEARRMFDDLVERATDVPPELEVLARRCRGNLAALSDQTELGLELYEQTLAQYRRLRDERGQAILEHRMGMNLVELGDRRRGRRLIEDSLARSQATGLRLLAAQARAALGTLEYREGVTERGLRMIEESVEVVRQAGYAWAELNMLNELALINLELGRRDEAERRGREALALGRRTGDRRHRIQSLAILAALAAARAQTERAGRLWGAVEAEERHGPLPRRPRMRAWEHDRERFLALVCAHPDADLERGFVEGRRLSLDQAVEEALADA